MKFDLMLEILKNEYENFQPGMEPKSSLDEWPACFNFMEPTNFTIKERLPECIIDSFRSHGIQDEGLMNLPIKISSILGKCHTNYFITCPNVPDYRTFDGIVDILDAEGEQQTKLLENMLKYTDGSAFYWIDMDLKDAKGKVIPLRMAYNLGDADSNEGYWGAVWHRESLERVADIRSVGDCATEIKVLPILIKMFTPYNCWLPVEFDTNKFDNMYIGSISHATNHELEKILQLALVICEDSRDQA
jgi:hypothetical protein